MTLPSTRGAYLLPTEAASETAERYQRPTNVLRQSLYHAVGFTALRGANVSTLNPIAGACAEETTKDHASAERSHRSTRCRGVDLSTFYHHLREERERISSRRVACPQLCYEQAEDELDDEGVVQVEREQVREEDEVPRDDRPLVMTPVVGSLGPTSGTPSQYHAGEALPLPACSLPLRARTPVGHLAPSDQVERKRPPPPISAGGAPQEGSTPEARGRAELQPSAVPSVERARGPAARQGHWRVDPGQTAATHPEHTDDPTPTMAPLRPAGANFP